MSNIKTPIEIKLMKDIKFLIDLNEEKTKLINKYKKKIKLQEYIINKNNKINIELTNKNNELTNKNNELNKINNDLININIELNNKNNDIYKLHIF
jgi:hypothetical protein